MQAPSADRLLMAPLSGLKLCITGFNAEERDALAKFVAQGGAEYSADLTKSCTHLIAKHPTGAKYK